MTDRERLTAQLRRHEGAKKERGRHMVYRCPAGKLTIGYGRNLEENGLSDEEADSLLVNDQVTAEAEVFRAMPWTQTLSDVRRFVWVNMAMNIGIGGLVAKNPKAIAACQRGDFAECARELLDGDWKDDVGARAHELARQMEAGTWQ